MARAASLAPVVDAAVGGDGRLAARAAVAQARRSERRRLAAERGAGAIVSAAGTRDVARRFVDRFLSG